jgi:hypothetical protein
MEMGTVIRTATARIPQKKPPKLWPATNPTLVLFFKMAPANESV